MAGVQSLIQLILPKKKTSDKGSAYTGTFRPANASNVLPVPAGLDHLTDLFTTRQVTDARTLLKTLFQQDPDVSAAVNAYLTVADVEPWWVVRDLTGAISRDGHKMVEQVLLSLFTRTDYTLPSNFQLKQGLRATCADLRYLLLLRGGIGTELVLNKQLLPSELRVLDMATVQWKEKAPGVYLPEQHPAGSNDIISLDLPTFFVSFFRRDPTEIYSNSFFVASINTIAARQQVVNDLYRIMRLTGYPRLDVTIIEEVLKKNAPADCKTDEDKMTTWVKERRNELASAIAGLRADQALVHTDSIEPKILNEKNPGAGLNIKEVIDTLNAQNQAALKVMATVIGRGEAGVNTASVEAIIFSRNAEQLNQPIADLLSQVLTLAIRLNGVEATVEFGFERIEMRPDLELEAQKTLKQTRYMTLLSFGIIDDDTFHLEMFNRIRPDAIPQLAGTNFMAPASPIDAGKASPNQDPQGRALTSEGSNQVKSN
jgi:hypothetical protein